MSYYLSSLVVLFVIQSILVLGLSFGYGTVGLLNFTYITFVAIGAYVGAIFTLGPPAAHSGFVYLYLGTLPWPINVLLGGVAAAIGGALVSIAILRGLRSDYLAIATVSAGFIFYTVIGDNRSIFNGWSGLYGIPNPVQGISSPAGEQLAFAGLCCIFLILTLVALTLIRRSPVGRTLRAIRDDGALVEALGRNVFVFRFWALVGSCFIAGVGGALLGEYASAFSPTAFLPPETFILFAAVILGGRGNNWGALLGAAIVPVGIAEATRYLPQIGDTTLIQDLRGGLIGIGLIVIIIFRPQGLIAERAGSILSPLFGRHDAVLRPEEQGRSKSATPRS